MKTSILIFSLLLLPVFPSAGQKLTLDSIPASRLDMYKVNPGSQGFGKTWNISFGEYKTVSGKQKAARSKNKSNLFSTKSESTTTSQFRFVLAGQDSAAATVSAASTTYLKSRHPVHLSENFSVGTEEILEKLDSFSATITLSGDTASAWILTMKTRTDQQSVSTYTATLSKGERIFTIRPARSDLNGGDKRLIPAQGYEIVANDSLFAALQYYGGGFTGGNKMFVWLARESDRPLRLVMAAACAALLNKRMSIMVAVE